ncbi:MAG: hypothetical protein WDW36_007635 [Sanguina aurantia]
MTTHTSSSTRRGVVAAATKKSAAKKAAAPSEPRKAPPAAVVELSACKRRATVVVPAALVKKGFTAVVNEFQKLMMSMPQDGFRPGQPLPLSKLIQEAGGQARFKTACVEKVLGDAMPLVFADPVTGRAIPDSENITTPGAILIDSFDPALPLSVELEYEVLPTISWKRPYRELEVTLQDSGDITTDAAATTDLILQYRKQHGSQRIVTGRGMTRGDICIVDLEVFVEGSSEPLPGLSKKRMHFDTDVDPLGLAASMSGMQPGNQQDISVVFPDDYEVELWQGLQGKAHVTIHELFTWVLPQFDDSFVTTHYAAMESADNMRKQLLATTVMQRLQQLDRDLEDVVMKAVVECAGVEEVPQALITDLGEKQYRAVLLKMVADLLPLSMPALRGRSLRRPPTTPCPATRVRVPGPSIPTRCVASPCRPDVAPPLVRAQRIATLKEVEELASPDSLREYIEKKREELTTATIFNLLVDDIIEAESLTLDQTDVDAEVAQRKQQYTSQGVEFDEVMLVAEVEETFKSVKVIEWLKDNVKRVVKPWKSDAPAAAAHAVAVAV